MSILRDTAKAMRRKRIESGGSRHGDEAEAMIEDLADRIAATIRRLVH